MNKNGYTKSWRDQEREDQCDYRLAEDKDHPLYDPNRPDPEIERQNRREDREMRGGW
jgi:hypothetical protein